MMRFLTLFAASTTVALCLPACSGADAASAEAEDLTGAEAASVAGPTIYSCKGTNPQRPGGGALAYTTGDFILVDGLKPALDANVMRSDSVVTDTKLSVHVLMTDKSGKSSPAEGMIRNASFARGTKTTWDNGSTLGMELQPGANPHSATVRFVHILGGKPVITPGTCTAKAAPACGTGRYLRCTETEGCVCATGKSTDVTCGRVLDPKAVCTPKP